ncbi:MAG: hypothetical protein RBR86_03875 [Pseudobdellovibrionaceae bacterium]|jgi:Ca2+-binding EF-hand superfamily protein|nr:hypothetical protein [Pseudobdellovibrionaceae bacterium]
MTKLIRKRAKAALMLASIGVAMTAISVESRAETVIEKTIISQREIPGVHKIDFMSFDENQDGILEMKEVGDVLFTAFDRDGNSVIDNQEFDENPVMTVIPTEKTTYTFYDYNSDGKAEKAVMTQEDFLKKSSLMRFDTQYNGLSPKDFIGKSFKEVDMTHDNLLDLEEWQRVYADIVKPEAALQSNYN